MIILESARLKDLPLTAGHPVLGARNAVKDFSLDQGEKPRNGHNLADIPIQATSPTEGATRFIGTCGRSRVVRARSRRCHYSGVSLEGKEMAGGAGAE